MKAHSASKTVTHITNDVVTLISANIFRLEQHSGVKNKTGTFYTPQADYPYYHMHLA